MIAMLRRSRCVMKDDDECPLSPISPSPPSPPPPISSPPLSPTSDHSLPSSSCPPGHLLTSGSPKAGRLLPPQPCSPPPYYPGPRSREHRGGKSRRKHTIVNRYCEEMNELNEVANNRPRSALIHSIQQENKHIRELQQENKELRLALEEHQNVMELIMSKYRQQVAKLITVNANSSHSPNLQDQAMLALQVERVSEMAAVMRKASQLDEDESIHNHKIISALVTENKGLREMLQIAMQSGVAVDHARTDAHTQTEVSDNTSDTQKDKIESNDDKSNQIFEQES